MFPKLKRIFLCLKIWGRYTYYLLRYYTFANDGILLTIATKPSHMWVNPNIAILEVFDITPKAIRRFNINPSFITFECCIKGRPEEILIDLGDVVSVEEVQDEDVPLL